MGLMIWRKAAVYALVALPAVGLAGTSLLAQQQQQQDSSQQSTGDPVADAARKAREQKKKETAKPKRVITDEDVNHLTLPDSPKETSEAGAKTAGEQAAPDSGKKEESPEKTWRKRFKDAYANLARTEKELDVLQREDNKAQTQYYSDPQKALAEQYTRKEINEKDTKIAAKKKEVEQLKEQISDMQEELRKSGGDSGWAAP
jgi:predicted RNase H-like nuclease (RuvC/YqgF family)